MTGTIRISLDFECGWGSVEDGKWRAREAAGVYTRLRPALRRFVDQLDALEIPCTWACVGAMIDSPDARDLSYLKGSYATKMQAFLAEADGPTMDGRDLLDMVTGARVAQAFGTHSYSHMNFHDPDQDGAVARAEMAQAARANKAAGIACEALVFPRNHVAHLEAVAASGVRMVRMPPANAGGGGRVKRALDAFLRPVSPVTEEVDADTGLVLHYASEFLNWGVGAGAVKQFATKRRHAAALKAAARGADVHFWLHPFNLAETAGLADHVSDILAQIATLRDQGRIEVKPF